METMNEFRQTLLSTLAKFGDNQNIAALEVNELMTLHITDTKRMTCFLSTISETNEFMKTKEKEESIKLYGKAAEIFEGDLVPFIPKIMGYLTKRLKNSDLTLQSTVADSMGLLVHNCVKNLPTQDEKTACVKDCLKVTYHNLASPSKQMQGGAGQCLARIIQNSPPECLIEILRSL